MSDAVVYVSSCLRFRFPGKFRTKTTQPEGLAVQWTAHGINAANFMAALITDNALWMQWNGKMPVIYNMRS
jgi:hypothetical protein